MFLYLIRHGQSEGNVATPPGPDRGAAGVLAGPGRGALGAALPVSGRGGRGGGLPRRPLGPGFVVQQGNGCINRVRITPEEVRIISINETVHLSEMM